MKTKKRLSILLTLCLVVGLAGLTALTVWATRPVNAVYANTTWYVTEEYGWVSKPTGDNTAQPTDVSIVSIDGDIELYEGAKLTIEMPTEMKIVSPMASYPPRIESIRDGDDVGGSVEIVEPIEPVEPENAFSAPTKVQLSINGADGTGGAAVELSDGLTVDVKELWKIEITGGDGVSGGIGGTGVDCPMTVESGDVKIVGGGGVIGNGSSGTGGTGVGADGDVTLTGGTLLVEGGKGSPGGSALAGSGGTGVAGRVTLAGGTLTVNGGQSGDGNDRALAFGDLASVTIAEGYAYTNGDGKTVYLAGTYTPETNPSIDAFAGKTLSLCEAKIGGTFYATLQKAFDNAKDGDTITLLRDIEQKTTLDISTVNSVTLDLNGRTVLFNIEDTAYFRRDKNIITITGSGKLEGRGKFNGIVMPFWRFCRDAAADTGTLTILNDAVMSFGNSADQPWRPFSNSITEAALEEGVTKIGFVTFCACEDLKTITIPSTVTSIIERSPDGLTESSPFDGCPKLEKIVVDAGNVTYSNNDGDGVLYTQDKTMLLFCPRGKTGILTVPAEVTTLKKYSFNNYAEDGSIGIDFSDISAG